jgi:hypothetical protein
MSFVKSRRRRVAVVLLGLVTVGTFAFSIATVANASVAAPAICQKYQCN